MKTLSIFAAALMLGSFASAQAAKPIPTEALKPLMAAIHKHDQVEKKISDLNMQFLQMQAQAKATMDKLQADEKETAAAMDKAEADAYRIAGLSAKDYAEDLDGFTFTPRPSTAPAPPAPAHQ